MRYSSAASTSASEGAVLSNITMPSHSWPVGTAALPVFVPVRELVRVVRVAARDDPLVRDVFRRVDPDDRQRDVGRDAEPRAIEMRRSRTSRDSGPTTSAPMPSARFSRAVSSSP